jgi:four helix bundle protein
MGSASQLEYHLLLSRDLGLVDTANYSQRALETTEVKRMPTSFIQTLKADR